VAIATDAYNLNPFFSSHGIVASSFREKKEAPRTCNRPNFLFNFGPGPGYSKRETQEERYIYT